MVQLENPSAMAAAFWSTRLMTQYFDLHAESYDGWYDRPDGRAIFNAELKCIRSLCDSCQRSWLEVGVGTGRFASGLQVPIGIDPSMPMLKIAKERGITVCGARAEYLPFRDKSFDGVLLALSLCFIENPPKALRECFRVLRPKGRFLVGIVPADSPWGRRYGINKDEGHPAYKEANFFQLSELVSLLKETGWTTCEAAGTLFWKPGELPEANPRIDKEMYDDAGFLTLLCAKNT
jgi:ubiquinone/menaquinone biosynthesis C-methylase UbiE